MELLLKICFWVAVGSIFYTYVGFHIVLEILFRIKKITYRKYLPNDDLPMVSVLLSVHNEEDVIREKIESTFDTDYPADKIELIIGSDNSNDDTVNIIKSMAEEEPRIKFIDFPNRQGKPGVINQLVSLAEGDVLVMTDAKVFFRPYTVFELVKYFKDNRVGIVGGNITSFQENSVGGVPQEKLYMSREMRVKYLEGKLWGAVAGVFGACFAISREVFRPVPPRYLVDDFYITMKVLSDGKYAVQDIKAVCVENVAPSMLEEFRRKVRISTGNFQNLKMFSGLLFRRRGIGFSVVSHKVMRWMGPFFLLAILGTLIGLMNHDFYRWMLILYLFSFVMVLVDAILMKFNKHFVILRFLTHFYFMNLALLIGFIRALRGVKTSAWEPTKR
ncbi:glycosyltransferase [Puteibacter caeruleilacunae]|nr:glycosyltransferase [Puteibacter caeruleilacunae]